MTCGFRRARTASGRSRGGTRPGDEEGTAAMADFSRLPGPNADLWDWQLRGLCRGKDSSLFFHPEGERGAARSSRESAAKEICMNCPVQISCADHALRVREPYGVWGGMTEE